MKDLETQYVPPAATCDATQFSETNQVHVRSLYGLWVILAFAVLIAGLAAVIHYLVLTKVQPERKKAIDERMVPFRESFRGLVRVPAAAEAFRKAGEARRLQSGRPAGDATAPGACERRSALVS
jgi:hypothetical protein